MFGENTSSGLVFDWYILEVQVHSQQVFGCLEMSRVYNTPPKTNMESKRDGFQKESPFPRVHFQVLC